MNHDDGTFVMRKKSTTGVGDFLRKHKKSQNVDRNTENDFDHQPNVGGAKIGTKPGKISVISKDARKKDI